MNDVKFIEYKPTPGEKHLGIATICINNLIYLRYKISAGKNGGYFPNPPSYKVMEYGTESYIAAFVIESNMLKEQVESCLKANINRILSQPQPAFNAQQAIQNSYARAEPQVHAPTQSNFVTGAMPSHNPAQAELAKPVDDSDIPF